MAARLVFLSGTKAGEQLDLGSGEITLGRSPECTVVFPPEQVLVSAHHATIIPTADGYRIRDDGSKNGTFVRKKKIAERDMVDDDVIELGPGGPTIRFESSAGRALGETMDAARPTLSGMYRLASLRSAGPDSGRLGRPLTLSREFVSLAYRRSSRATRVVTGALVLALLISIGALVAWNVRTRSALQRSLNNLALALESESADRARLARDLAAVETANDSLQRLFSVSRNAEPEEPLGRAVDRNFGDGVALIVFAYGFAERGTGRLLRYAVDAGGAVTHVMTPRGVAVPQLTFRGAGPPVQKTGSATGFLIDSTGWIVTNRHVALPWVDDRDLERMLADGMEIDPTLTLMRAYFPPGNRPYPLVVERVSDDQDVALLRSLVPGIDAPLLRLAPPDREVVPGDPVVLIGYPTGVHNLMFRVSAAERAAIMQAVGEGASPIQLAAELARRDLIQPLVTSGDVSDTTGTEVIHTAESTGGSSGGPIIDSSQRVVAIHYAYVTSPVAGDPFRTQRGVQVRFVWDLLPEGLAAALVRQR